MDYKKILLKLAEKYNETPENVEKEMEKAIRSADIHCDVEEFILKVSDSIITNMQNRL